MKKLLALALAAVMALSMVACGGGDTEKTTIDKILEQGYITCAISPDFAPSVFKDPSTGEVMGTDVEYAKFVANYISEKYGKPVELKIEELDFSSCQVATSANNVHFSVNGYAATPERAENFILAGPYATVSAEDDTYHGALIKADSDLVLKTADDFKGLKIGCQMGSLQYNLATVQLPTDEMQDIELITDLSIGALMVAEGKIDALISDSGAAAIMISANPGLKMADFQFEYEGEGNVALVNIDEVELGALITEALQAADDVIDYDTLRQEMADKAASMGLEVNE